MCSSVPCDFARSDPEANPFWGFQGWVTFVSAFSLQIEERGLQDLFLFITLIMLGCRFRAVAAYLPPFFMRTSHPGSLELSYEPREARTHSLVKKFICLITPLL